ncbi:MAG: outer membrane protein assembly factor BamB family protein, partial [Planctomycetota bacterium]
MRIGTGNRCWRRKWAGLSGVLTVLLAVGIAGGQAEDAAAVDDTLEPMGAGIVVLVPFDEEITRYLGQTRDLIDAGDYDQAIRSLQALLAQEEALYVPTSERGLFRSLRVEINETLAALTDEGRRRYRLLYDPPARRLLRQAIQSGDLQLLRQVAMDYSQTVSGPDALEALGHVAFDRARFVAAGRYWQQAAWSADGAAAAGLLAKAAVAYHLAGRDAQAGALERQLADAHPQAGGDWAGRGEDLLTAVRRLRRLQPWQAPDVAVDRWPGYGAIEGSVRPMQQPRRPNRVRWTFTPSKDGRASADELLAAQAEAAQLGQGSRGQTCQLVLADGHVQANFAGPNGPGAELMLPALILPVVMEETVVFRTDDAVVACDADSGQLRWRREFPIHGQLQLPELSQDVRMRMGYSGYYMPPSVDDGGQYWLTVGDDAIYALGGLAPDWMLDPSIARIAMAMGEDYRIEMPRPRLLALSTREEGKVLWTAPNRDRPDDPVNDYHLASPAGHHNGHVYVIATKLGRYHLLCLDGRSGKLVWATPISQMPMMPEQGSMASMIAFQVLHRCSPPTVAGGRVYALTNAGVLAAYDADSGQALWAYQYDSTLNGVQGASGGLRSDSVIYPVNPLVVVEERLIVLPPDSAKVLCLGARDGSLQWSASRNAMHYLAGLDRGRVLLTRNGWTVIDVDDGSVQLNQGHVEFPDLPDDGRTVGGRPAVTADAAFISGQRGLIRLDLSEDPLTADSAERMSLPFSDTLLGSLVIAKGRLIAANSAGVVAYDDYDGVHQAIEERLDELAPAERMDMLFDRGLSAMLAGEYVQALADFQACERLAETASVQPRPELKQLLYRTCVLAANAAGMGPGMLALLDQADGYATTDRDRAHNLLRRAKLLRDMDDLPGAVAAAQTLADQYGEQDIVDVAIGPDAPLDRHRADAETTVVSQLIHDGFIPDLIAEHGQEVYAAYDADARQTLTEAQLAGDPEAMAAIAGRWPNSVWADDAQFAAAEQWVGQALAAGDSADSDWLQQAEESLTGVIARPLAELTVPAYVGLTWIAARQGRTAASTIYAIEARAAAKRLNTGEPVVQFADVAGPLDQVLSQLTDRPRVGPPPEPLVRIDPPLRRRFMLPGGGAQVICDARYVPVGVEGRVFVAVGDELLCLDPAVADPDAAVIWRADWPNKLPRHAIYMIWPGFGGYLFGDLTDDGKVLLVADGGSVGAFDVDTGRARWRTDLGPGQFDSEGVFNSEEGPRDPDDFIAMDCANNAWVMVNRGGHVICLDMADGTLRWRAEGRRRYDSYNTQVWMNETATLVVSFGSRTVMAFDTVSGKRLVEPIVGVRAADVGITPGGLV